MEWFWVTLKVCRTTRSPFALTLLSFTPFFAIALIYFAIIPINLITFSTLSFKDYQGLWYCWSAFICLSFMALMPMQSWLFGMQYLKSYLYTFVGPDSIVYKIHTFVKYFVILTYIALLTYFKLLEGSAYNKYLDQTDECFATDGDDFLTCMSEAWRSYLAKALSICFLKCA